MLDFDEESKRTESEEVAANGKAPDKIDDEYDYEAKYEKTYAKYDFKGSDRFDKTGEYHTDKSYAAQSTNVEQVKKAPRVTAWTTFFKSIPYPLICIVVYLALGFALNAWHPAWVIFLTIPAYYSFIEKLHYDGRSPLPDFHNRFDCVSSDGIFGQTLASRLDRVFCVAALLHFRQLNANQAHKAYRLYLVLHRDLRCHRRDA
ncbi:MAG: hypothetical protein L6V85_07960 [Clostridiales bacterium]|nr:MAG: hypothetical protein L6V85_07960 [Clostridiales bacterium]